MSGGTHSQGAFGKMLIEPGAGPHTFDGSSLAIEFLAETMSEHGRLGGLLGIRGTLRKENARLRRLTSFVYGTVTMYVSPNDIANLAANVFGMNESPGGTFTMDDTLPFFGMLIDPDSTVATSDSPYEFEDCMINNWAIQGRAPQFGEDGEPEMMQLQLGIIGSVVNQATSWPGSPPSLGTAAADAPYTFNDAEGGITLAGSARNVQQWLMTVNHNVYAKYVNSLSAHSHRPTTRDINLAVELPLNSDNDDLYDQAATAATGSFVLTNGAFSSTFTFGRIRFPPQTPVIQGKREVPLRLQGFVTGTGSTPDLVIVNDNTP